MSIYAIDFDGTLCERKYPNIGEKKDKMIEFVKTLNQEGHKAILWTCRKDQELQNAVSWCADLGIEFDSVNENLPEIIEKYGGDSRKIHADYYIDDKNLFVEDMSAEERKKALIDKLRAVKVQHK